MTRTQNLTNQIKAIYLSKQDQVSALPRTGPNGGSNAAYIDGWTHSPNGTISKACGLAGVPLMPLWSGSLPTPSTAIPSCMYDDVMAAYTAIFN
jgi:hypothetical protein